MSITRSYNRHNNTYYAYETEYVFDEANQKKVLKRRCVGKYDSDGNIIPNGNRGRRKTAFPVSEKEQSSKSTKAVSTATQELLADTLSSKKQTIGDAVALTVSLVNELEADVDNIRTTLDNLHSKLSDTEDRLSAVVTMLHDLTDADTVLENTTSESEQ